MWKNELDPREGLLREATINLRQRNEWRTSYPVKEADDVMQFNDYESRIP